MYTVKVKGVFTGLSGTASNVNTSVVVCITNANTIAPTTITQNTGDGLTTVGTIIVPPATMVGLVKANTDTLQSSLTTLVTATPIAFTN